MSNRVVITGLGVVSPNGIGIPEFKNAIKNGVSGIRLIDRLVDLNFEAQIGGIPQISEELKSKYFTPLELMKFNASGILYGVIAGIDAWQDAGLKLGELDEEPDWDSGMIYGIGSIAADKLRDGIVLIDKLQVKRLGSNFVIQTMPSGISAYLAGKLGVGNQATTNSSACATGSESILMAYDRIKAGKAKRMLAGGTNDSSPYTWAGFDALRVTTYKHNDEPEKASQPMGNGASGFVAGSGSGAMVLESLESALERGAHIYAEILGGNINTGGQKGDGSMTLPNSVGVQRCILEALKDAGITANDIDVINGHLTSTGKCNLEIKNWAEALNRKGKDFPYITALKSMIGHTLGAAGAIESIAAVLQLEEGFLIPNINCENIDPEILKLVDEEKITKAYTKKDINIIAKSSFGFGDVNACVIYKKYTGN
ncbi:beta-ketoacyl-[acyl-carrier-protein] synthase family protein [Flavobacterium sp.]|jgi:3-oxoacyl-(acyl-carrier-protein) synthase|uniref:beta-ketoacyl-[acyl-carrier-protein] synthase family protein n=1 Tax=Flavobacterium sp. TaxID=239 RepID=UPI0037BEFE12